MMANPHSQQRSILLHCPEDLDAEMKAICEQNHWNRTSFIIAACKLMLKRLKEQSLIPPLETNITIPDEHTEHAPLPNEERMEFQANRGE